MHGMLVYKEQAGASAGIPEVRRMRKLNLTEWAALGEVIGTVAIVISLLFVAFTIKQNTEALQGANENVIFERHAELASVFITEPSMAAIMVKMRGQNPQLSEVQAIQWEKYQLNLLDIWALARERYQQGLLSEYQWNTWDDYFTELFTSGAERISKVQWEELRYGFGGRFWLHVNESLFLEQTD